jgi:hypothetical protein
MIGHGNVIGLGFWSEIAIPLGVMVVVVPLVMLLDRPRLRRLRRKHPETHPPLCAEDFLQQIEVPPARVNIALGVRRGVAAAMGVSPETLYPCDHLEYICQFGFDGLDLFEIDMHVGKALNVTIRSDFWKPLFPVKRPARDVSLAELSRFVVENWDSLPKPEAGKAESENR